jgi:hypothetical protein
MSTFIPQSFRSVLFVATLSLCLAWVMVLFNSAGENLWNWYPLMRTTRRFKPYLKQVLLSKQKNPVGLSNSYGGWYVLTLVALHTTLSPNTCVAAVIRDDGIKLNKMEYTIGDLDTVKEDDRKPSYICLVSQTDWSKPNSDLLLQFWRATQLLALFSTKQLMTYLQLLLGRIMVSSATELKVQV